MRQFPMYDPRKAQPEYKVLTVFKEPLRKGQDFFS